MSAGLVLGGRYVLQSQLGAGGFGSVWRGRDNTLLREVAIKLVQFESDADSTLRDVSTQRFLREAQAVASLNHPNVVGVYDYGVQDDTAFMVMELVQGASLAQQARRRREQGLGPMDVATVVRVAIEICAGLGAAHRAGLVHRDLKPANVMIVDPSGQVKIVDFGIARAADRSRLTRTGSYMGTLPYIAPEQMSTAPMDGRADIYSFGCMLHELLTGRSPYVAEAPVQWLAAHQYAEPARLSAHLPGAPLALERLILDMLAKDPAARPATAEAVQERLAAIRTVPAGGPNPMALPVPGAEPPPDRPATSPPLLPPGLAVPVLGATSVAGTEPIAPPPYVPAGGAPVPLSDVTSVEGTEAIPPYMAAGAVPPISAPPGPVSSPPSTPPPPMHLPAAGAEAAPMHLPVSGPPVAPPVSAPPMSPPVWPWPPDPASAPPAGSPPPVAIPMSMQPATNPPGPPMHLPISDPPAQPAPAMHLPLGTPTPASAPPATPTSVPPLNTPQMPPSTPPFGTVGGYPPGPPPPGFTPPPGKRRGNRTAIVALVIAIIVVIAGTAVLLGPLHLLSGSNHNTTTLNSPPVTPITPTGSASNPNGGGAACHLKIAYLGTRNSAFGTRDDAEINGMNLALAQYNQKHPGCPVTPATFDTNPSNLANPPASTAKAAAAKLVADASIVGVVGPATSGDAGSVAGTMKGAGIPWISPSATSDDLTGLGGGTFHRAIGGRSILNNTLAGYVASLSGAKVFLVDDGSNFGKQLSAAVQAAAGGSVVGTDRVAPDGQQTNFGGTVNKIKNAGATVVVYGGYAQNAGRLLSQLRAAGSAAQFFADDVTDQPDFARLAGSAATAGTATFFCLCDMPAVSNPTFAAAYAATNGNKQPNLYADIAYDVTNMMLAGIQAGKITRAGMLSYLASTSYQGTISTYKFNADGTLNPADIVAYRFTDNGAGSGTPTKMTPVLP